ncbi:Transglutaminase-like enzyme, putative cysteine protease [Lachnospiraceae bacterium TWA4]|nr:Transglutaminase-like enzyme, putative cysteine protease [Lachnospiraceae bacterium TWA4]
MDEIVSFRTLTYEQIRDYRYGKDTLPEGKLYKASTIYDEEDVPRILVKSLKSENLYLRGFTGDNYKNGAWTRLANSSFGGKYSGILNWLEKQDFNPIAQFSSYLTLGDFPKVENDVTIRNINANRQYLYETYSSVIPKDFLGRAYNDNGYRSFGLFGSKETSFTTIFEKYPTEYLSVAQWIEEPQNQKQATYAKAEQVYRDFVYKNYVEVAPEVKDEIEKVFHKGQSPKSVYEATLMIRLTLKNKMNYSKYMDEIPETVDPIRYFLQGGSGNSVLCASTAVEAFRSFKIPARYVEGYHCFAVVDSAEKDYKETLTSKNAHAWCEVYMDGMGWMPIDVTPGYYFEVKNPSELFENFEKYTNQMNERIREEDKEASLKNQYKSMQTGELKQVEKQNETIIWGLIALVILGITIIVSGFCLIRKIILTFRLKLAKKKGHRSYVNYIWKRIIEILKSLDIDVNLGVEAEKTENLIRTKMPLIIEGTYCKLNDIMEYFYYSGAKEELKSYEMRLLLNFYKQLEEGIHQYSIKEQIKFWIKDTKQLLLGGKT